jgi:hypothetical protein
MPTRGGDPWSLKRRKSPSSWSPGDAINKTTSEVVEAITAIEARKAKIAQRSKMAAQQQTKTSTKRRKKKKRKEQISRGEERDIYTKGYRLDGSGWAGKGQR